MTSPLDTQANQMADEFAGCGYVGPMARARFVLAIKPLLERLHAQATQLTLAKHFASENERLKQRVKELEELQLLDVHAICDQRDGYRAECDKLRRALRYLFYTRLPLGEKLEEFLAQDQPDKWQEIFALLADKSAMQNKNDGGMKI
jgi:hypothetical protein